MLIEMSFKELIAEKKFQGLTDNSLKSYEILFNVLRNQFMQEGIEHTQDLTTGTIKSFLRSCMEKGTKPKTINSKSKLIRAWSRWMLEEEIIDKDVCKGIKLIREDDSPKIVREEKIVFIPQDSHHYDYFNWNRVINELVSLDLNDMI